MGIPVYFSHIIKQYVDILKKIENKTFFDILFLDANSIIYDVYYSIIKDHNNYLTKHLEELIIKNTIEKIKEIINLFEIKKEIVICFDGVAPLSKLKQQRERRFKTWIKSKIINSSQWNTCKITPGTKFMESLNKHLSIFEKQHNNVKILNSNYPGEGEQKIFDYLSHKYPNNNEKHVLMEKNNLKICIYGLDSDLIMLSLLHSNFYNKIFLYRETPEFIKNLNKKLDYKEKYLLNIQNLNKHITNSLYINPITEHYFKTNMNYIILFFLVGNDFVPHHPGLSLRLNGAETLIQLYKDFLQERDLFYILNNKFFIDWDSIKIIIRELAKKEQENIKDYHEYKSNIQKKIIKNDKIMKSKEELLNFLPLFNTEDEQYILSNPECMNERYYKKSFGCEYNIKNICYHYLKNIEWNFFYYIGQDNECDLNYYYPYYHAPLFTDCIKYIPLKFETLYNKNKLENTYIHPATQLLYILPSSYYNLIDDKIVNNIEFNNNEKFCELFKDPSNLVIDIDYNFVKYFFESVIHFKFIDVQLLNNEVLKNI
tara:strand:- start:564 stop:2189 length:1626 start_codon:yes stop_codon:yes gene_type:complete